LLYHYFPTKRDLYVAAMREIADELVERVAATPVDLAPVDRVKGGLDAYLDHVHHHARAFVALMRGGIGSDPEVAAVIESVRTRLFERFLQGSPVAAMLRNDPRFAIALRGWLGFVEAASIDWCDRPRLSRAELRDLLAGVLFATMQQVAPAGVS
jgi:AcrR family transcriptional regulator